MLLERPNCRGETLLIENQNLTLFCESNYSGSVLPKLNWFRGDELLNSRDEYEIRLAKQSIEVSISHEDDKRKFTCQMIFGDFIEECSIFLDVACK